jgi:uncharacterized repeat protein (TIGR01451 family)
MLKRKIVSATVVICLMGLARMAMAQNNSDQFRPFNGFFANMFGDDSPPQQPQHQVQNNSTNNYNSTGTTQLQRVPTRAPQPAPQVYADPPPVPTPNGVDNYNSSLPAPPVTSAAPSRSSATGNNFSFHYEDGTLPSGPALNPPPPSTSPSNDAAPSYSVPAASAGVPLHERLKVFRQSPFGDTAETTPSAVNPPPAVAAGESTTPAQPSAPAALPAPPAEPPTAAQPTPLAATRSTGSPPSSQTLSSPPADAEPRPASGYPLSPAKAANEAAQEPSVLIDRKSPLLTVETIGPRKIVVGKEAAYEVLLQNSGEVAAEEVTVTVTLPDWAVVAGTSASSGEVPPMPQDHRDPCRWVLGRIEAHSKEKLTLRIVPRQSKPFELAVRWDFKQAASQAMIEVQEPKLTMHLDGPREVVFGRREVYKLRLGNSGNGVAENVSLALMPLNAGDTHPITHRLGTINAGDDRTIEIELTARQAGNVTIRVEANGDGGAHVDLAEHVLVHRGTLQVEAEGPAVQYVGTPANYKIRVRNSGDALAKNVRLTAKLPTGVKFVSGSDGAGTESTPDGAKVRWTIDKLPPGEQRVLDMKCTLALSGPNRLEITSTADDDLVAVAETITRVEAMADLRLDVKDPEGPVPLGSDATYELHVRNRGTKTAENVEVMAYFSNGVEPVSAAGQPHHISPGQVVFERIPAVPPAAQVVLTVKAKAGLAGNHVFRAELHCKTTGTRLVREEVTHFYQDGPSLQAAAAPAATPTGPVTREETRTAERPARGYPAPLPLPPGPGQPLPAVQR